MKNNITLLDPISDPFILFAKWFEDANKKEINDANAMNLSTVTDDLQPSSRMVLLKDFDKNGFVFYSNLNSKKGVSISSNPKVSLNFHWKSLLRQVRIEGEIKEVSSSEADKYFKSRHSESKIGAWASKQSSELNDRKILEEKIIFYRSKFLNREIPRPEHWTGFRVNANLIEFWQDMPHRLHDRLEYKKINNLWHSKKLFP